MRTCNPMYIRAMWACENLCMCVYNDNACCVLLLQQNHNLFLAEVAD